MTVQSNTEGIAKQLKKARNEQGLKADFVAKKLGWANDRISRFENGKQ